MAATTAQEERDQARGERQYRAHLRRRDRSYDRAYRAGKRGQPLPEDLADDADAREYHAFGQGERQGSQPTEGTAPRWLNPGWASKPATDQAAGALWGLVGFCLAINYLRYGWPGVTGWVAAKFWNKPMGATAPVGAAPAPAAVPPSTPSPGTYLGPPQGAPAAPNFPTTTPTPVM